MITDVAQDPYARAVWQALSRERLGGYGGAGVPWVDVLSRYLWNIALCEATYPTLQTLEVALRNAVFDAGCASYPFTASPSLAQVPCWLDTAVLLPGDRSKVAGAKARLRDAGKPPEPCRLVAELTFGFWTTLFDVRYENTRILWPRLFGQKIFADAPKRFRNRKALSPLLNRVRHLRNRAFHHEPIWHWRDLREQHAIALDLIGWMSPPLRETVGALDRFDAVYADGLDPFREIVLTAAGTARAA